MKKIYSFLLLAAIGLFGAQSIKAATVYFVNSRGWESVYAYSYNPVDGGAWPGTNITENTSVVNGVTVYSFTTTGEYVIFNDGGGHQTGDLSTQDGKYFSPLMGGIWFTENEMNGDFSETDHHFYLKTDWKNLYTAWSWSDALTNNGDGTFSIEAAYSGDGCDYNQTNSDVNSEWLASPILVNDPAEGDPCTYTLNPIAGTITISKIIGAPKSVYYVNSSEWEHVYCYAYTDEDEDSTPEAMNAEWPGVELSTTTVDGVVMYEYTTTDEYANVIFNDNAGHQTDDLAWNTGQCYLDGVWYVAEYVPNAHHKLIVKDNTDWERLNVYAWGEREILGTWTGTDVRAGELVADAEYNLYYEIDMFAHEGTTYHLIFNNKNGDEGQQLGDFDITFDGDKVVSVTSSAASLITPAPTCTKAMVRTADNTNFQSLCVPFDATISNAKAYKINAVGNDYVSLEENANLIAGHSYIIQPEDEGDIVIKKTVEGDEVANPVDDTYHFGCLNEEGFDVYPNTDPEYPDIYFLLDNQLHLLSGDATATVSRYHAFFKLSIPAGAPALRIVLAENGATNIQNIEGNETAQKFIENGKVLILREGVVYDMTGRVVR